ncbi:MAG: SirB2 family protein [Gammaproteobacteria bacterium]|jgi:uncharacterized membrane protein SirB2
MTWYVLFKSVHVVSISISAVLFVTRGVWLLRDSDRLTRRWVRVAPHIVDTILLLSAIALVIQLHQYPFVHHWLTAKVLALLVYIALGMVAFRFARARRWQVISWVTALVVLAYIIAVALTHSPSAGL